MLSTPLLSVAAAVRNILNWQELEQQCNKFTGWKLENTPFKRVQCRCALGLPTWLSGAASWAPVQAAAGHCCMLA